MFVPPELPLDVLRWSLAARLAGARLVFLSVGAGPIDQTWSRRFLRLAVSLAHEVSYRDSRSQDFMASIGRDVGSDRVLPDLALALDPPDRSRDRLAERARWRSGCSPRFNWPGRDRDTTATRSGHRRAHRADWRSDRRRILLVTGTRPTSIRDDAIVRRLH